MLPLPKFGPLRNHIFVLIKIRWDHIYRSNKEFCPVHDILLRVMYHSLGFRLLLQHHYYVITNSKFMIHVKNLLKLHERYYLREQTKCTIHYATKSYKIIPKLLTLAEQLPEQIITLEREHVLMLVPKGKTIKKTACSIECIVL